MGRALWIDNWQKPHFRYTLLVAWGVRRIGYLDKLRKTGDIRQSVTILDLVIICSNGSDGVDARL